ncbi:MULTISPECIES: MlaD family protein [Nitrincola]|uniref:Virulence factor Mce family protein n=1 Tax=Nitrincola nitratireducens TaxID=1229521 RepID=W9UZX2_9GAMM|nr:MULTISPECIES: MlaD family protein [Nitrincola]EXJ09402.1 virulence factor Mce family protein [Nitrincola nitratireducens]
MNPRINYTLVGVFVVFLTLAGLGLLAWLSQDTRQLQRQPYVTYFSESVAGLNERATVRYLGVPVGIVERISLDQEVEGRVRLDLRIDPETPIRESSVASLQNQGITGLLFVEISSGEAGSPRLKTSADAPAVITSRASRLLQIADALGESLGQVNELIQNLNNLTFQISLLTDAEMRDKIGALLDSVVRLTTSFDAQLETLDLQVYSDLAHSLIQLSDEMQQQLVRIPDSVDGMGRQVQESLEQAGRQLALISRDSQATARQVSPVLSELETLLELLNRDTNVWLKGAGKRPPGPGETP